MLHFVIWQTAIVLMLLALSIAIISRRVILPLKKIMVVLGKLRKEDYDLEIPYTRYRDEFGSLSRSFSGFRESLIEKKQAEQEREKLIIELKDAIANIKTLSGLLPICAGCKKIRNDQGYWQQWKAISPITPKPTSVTESVPSARKNYIPIITKRLQKIRNEVASALKEKAPAGCERRRGLFGFNNLRGFDFDRANFILGNLPDGIERRIGQEVDGRLPEMEVHKDSAPRRASRDKRFGRYAAPP